MGKGRSSAPAEQTVRQTQLPEYADPYFRRLLQGAEEATMPFYPDDPAYGDLAGQSTYVPYGGERIAPSQMYGDIMASRAMTRGIAESGIAGMPQAQGAAQAAMDIQSDALGGLRRLADYQTGDFYGYQPTSMMDEFSAFQGTQVDPTSMRGTFLAADTSDFADIYQAADTRDFADEFQAVQATSALDEVQAFDPNQYTGFEQAQFQEAEFTPFGEFDEYQFRAPTEFSEFEFRPDYSFQQFQYQEPEDFTAAAAERYMSPYMQAVVESQQEAAQREFERQGAGRAAQAVQAGAFGGSRQAVQEALAEEALGRQVADIQRTGMQTAFEQAARQFESDRAARMTQEERQAQEASRFQAATAAEQARVDQARFTELSSREQAQAAEYARAGDQDAAEKARVQAAKYQDLARIQAGKAAEMGRVQAGIAGEMGRVQAAEAAENARMDAIMQQEAARTQAARMAEIARLDDFARMEAGRTQAGRVGELGRAQGLTAQEMARVQAGQVGEFGRAQGLTAQEMARVQAAEAAEQARLDQFSAAEQGRLDALDASELARIQGARAAEMGRLDALGASELARIQAAQEASRQFGAGQGLAAYQAIGSGASNLAGLGAGLASLGERQRAADIQGAQLLEAIGRDIRAEDQGRLDLAYEDFLRQRDYPISQYERFAGLLRGVPVTPDVTSTRMASYNPVQQALGAGISALGLYRGLTG